MTIQFQQPIPVRVRPLEELRNVSLLDMTAAEMLTFEQQDPVGFKAAEEKLGKPTSAVVNPVRFVNGQQV